MAMWKNFVTMKCLILLNFIITAGLLIPSVLYLNNLQQHKTKFVTSSDLTPLHHADLKRVDELDIHDMNTAQMNATKTRIPNEMPMSTKSNTDDLENQMGRQNLYSEEPNTRVMKSIAIGLGISTRGSNTDAKSLKVKNIKGISFFTDLLPSFCETYSEDFSYHFYIAYDFNDPFLGVEYNVAFFKRYYTKILQTDCPKVPTANITFLKVNYTKKPAWAQNDAMMRAYLDHHDYYYRLNDDTILSSRDWQQAFIDVLSKYDPPNVGVVGPSYSYGNREILAYDFVHRTHIDIFGFYYPRVFQGYHADRWISDVYKPSRSTKHDRIWIKHIEKYGQRYPSHKLEKQTVQMIVKEHHDFLNRYLNNIASYNTSHNVTPLRSHVISFSPEDYLNETSLHGLLRNTLLAKQYLPHWTVRLTLPTTDILPKHYEMKLRQEGLDIRIMETNGIPSRMLRPLVIDDSEVEVFLLRDVHERIGPRDAAMVGEWLRSTKGIHCVIDHPVQDASNLGGNTHTMRTLLGNNTMHDILMKFCNDKICNEIEIFKTIKTILNFDKIRETLFCHNTVSCSSEPFMHDFIFERFQGEYIGQKFDVHEIPLDMFPQDFNRNC